MAVAVFLATMASCLLWGAGGVALWVAGGLIGLWQGASWRVVLWLAWLRLPLISLALLPGALCVGIVTAVTGMPQAEYVLSVAVAYIVGAVLAAQNGIGDFGEGGQ